MHLLQWRCGLAVFSRKTRFSSRASNDRLTDSPPQMTAEFVLLPIHDVQVVADQIDRISAHHHFKRARFHNPLHLSIQIRKFLGAQREFDGLCFARIERHSMESSQLLHRARYRTYFLMDVKLCHLIAAPCANIRHVYADSRLPFGTDGVRRNPKIRVLEGRVTQSPAERKQWLDATAEISAFRRRFLVIIIRQLSYRTRHANRKFAFGIVIAKDHVRGRGSTFLPEVPAIKDCWH